jgi:hypothetical protein
MKEWQQGRQRLREDEERIVVRSFQGKQDKARESDGALDSQEKVILLSSHTLQRPLKSCVRGKFVREMCFVVHTGGIGVIGEMESSLIRLVNGMRYFGAGSKVTRSIYKFPDTYWIVKR